MVNIGVCVGAAGFTLGLSLAGWNGVYAAVMLAATLVLLFGDWRSAAEQHRRPRLA